MTTAWFDGDESQCVRALMRVNYKSVSLVTRCLLTEALRADRISRDRNLVLFNQIPIKLVRDPQKKKNIQTHARALATAAFTAICCGGDRPNALRGVNALRTVQCATSMQSAG